MSITADSVRTDDPINIVNFETGATVKPGPMVTAVPERIVQDDQLQAFAPESGLNAPFVADLLSAAIAHERSGVNLFRMLERISANPLLITEYKRLAGEAMTASKEWAALITDLGGSPQYASPPGRLTETMDQKIVESFQGTGSADPLSIEMAGVQAVLAAATLCVAFVDALQLLAKEASGPSGDRMKNAARTLRPAAEEHVVWANKQMQMMVKQLAKHSAAQKIGQAAEHMVSKVKEKLS